MTDGVKPLAKAGGFAFLAAALALILIYPAHAEPLGRVDIGAPAPGFTAMGADGREHSLADYAGRIVVLEWTSPVCPFTAVKYDSGAMQALQRHAAGRGVVWLSIDTAAPGRPAYLTPAAANARIAKTHARVSGFLFDTDGRIGRRYGAKATPGFFIIGADGRLAYQGSMSGEREVARGDDSGPAKDAIDDLSSGRPVQTPETPPYGCAIEY